MADAVKKLEPVKSEPDWSKELELTGIWLTKPLRVGNAPESVIVGNHISDGMGTSGTVRRVVHLPNGCVRVLVSAGADEAGQWLMFYPGGIVFGQVKGAKDGA